MTQTTREATLQRRHRVILDAIGQTDPDRWRRLYSAVTAEIDRHVMARKSSEARQLADKIAAHPNTTDGYTWNSAQIAAIVARQPRYNSTVIAAMDTLEGIYERIRTNDYADVKAARRAANARRAAAAK